MSWFSFALEFSNSWKSYSQIRSFGSGQFIANTLFDKQISNNHFYKSIKQKIADSFSRQARAHFEPSSREIATRILKKHLTYQALSSVIQKLTAEAKTLAYDGLKTKLGFSAHLVNPEVKQIQPSCPEDPLKLSNTQKISPERKGSRSRLKNLKNYLAKNYDAKDSEELKNLLNNWRLKKFILSSIQLSLRPVCEKAVLEAITATTKAGTNFGVDLTSKKILCLVSLPLLSYLFSTAAEWTTYLLQEQIEQIEQNPSVALGSELISYLPSTKTILTVSTLYHLAQVGCAWHSAYSRKSTISTDKVRLRELSMQLVQKRLADKIKINPVTRKLQLELSQATVDQVAANLIDETIDSYWQKLSETSILGMPLVNSLDS